MMTSQRCGRTVPSAIATPLRTVVGLTKVAACDNAPMRRASVALLLTAALAPAAPIPRDRLELPPWMWPSQKEALAKKVEREIAANRPIGPLLRTEGIDERALDLLAILPDGPRFHERYIHRLTLRVHGLGERQRTLLRTLIHAMDGAQLTLDAARAHGDESQRARIDFRIAALERRFWRLVMYALTADQRVDLKDLLPEANIHAPNALGHLFLLEDMTPRQATRAIAMLKEYESETAPDVAAARRLRALAKPAEAAQFDRRVQDRYKELFEEIEPVFTKKQWTELRGLVPFVPPEDRKKHPSEIVKAAKPRPEQMARLTELGRRIESVRRKVTAEAARKRKEMAAEIGEESPQATTMNMMNASAEATTVAVMAEAAHEAIVEILDPDQVSLWLLSAD